MNSSSFLIADCAIDPSERFNCGGPRISKASCEKNNCCFDDTWQKGDGGKNRCYHSKSKRERDRTGIGRVKFYAIARRVDKYYYNPQSKPGSVREGLIRVNM